jgi:hypothetical protein
MMRMSARAAWSLTKRQRSFIALISCEWGARPEREGASDTPGSMRTFTSAVSMKKAELRTPKDSAARGVMIMVYLDPQPA